MTSSEQRTGAPRRALLVSHRPLEYGGTLRWRHLREELAGLGWDVIPVTPPPSLTGDQASADPRVAHWSEVRARVMGRVGRAIRPAYRPLGFQPEAFPPNALWSFTGRRAIRAAVAAHDPEVVIATSPPPAALFAAAAALPPSLPLVADLRDPWAGSPFYDGGGRLLTRIERRALGRAAAIVAVTNPMEAQLRARHPDLADRMRVLPNGFPPALLERRARPDRAGARPFTLIHPGTLYGERTLADVIAALARPELRGRARLEIVGNVNPSTDEAIAAAPADVEVEVAPPLPWEDTIDRMRAADAVVVVQPASLGDDIAWPVKTFEALALGRPILSVTSGGAVETLLRELGVATGCARLGDAGSVAGAVVRLMESPPAPVAAARLAGWDRHAVARAYATLLDEVAAVRGPRDHDRTFAPHEALTLT